MLIEMLSHAYPSDRYDDCEKSLQSRSSSIQRIIIKLQAVKTFSKRSCRTSFVYASSDSLCPPSLQLYMNVTWTSPSGGKYL